MTIRDRLPAGVKRPARRAAHLVADALGGASVALRVRRGGPVRVFYGHAVPRLDEPAYGGMVKLQHMQRAFPNATRDFGILYMVSSRPPAGAVGMALVTRRRGAAVVWNQNGVAYPAWAGAEWRRANERTRLMLGLADRVLYQSEFCRTTTERFVGVPASGSWEVVYNPVDTALFTPADRPPGGLVLLLAGAQHQRYRLTTALDVLARVRRSRPEATLIVLGRLVWPPSDEAANRRDADEIADRLGLAGAVTYLGEYSQHDAPRLFHRAHLLLHTQYNDASPGVVLEALSCGLPVVYSRSGGVPELVGDEAGIGVDTEISWERVVPPDPAAMAEAILRLMPSYDRYARAARARAIERFDLALWIDRHRRIFEALA